MKLDPCLALRVAAALSALSAPARADEATAPAPAESAPPSTGAAAAAAPAPVDPAPTSAAPEPEAEPALEPALLEPALLEPGLVLGPVPALAVPALAVPALGAPALAPPMPAPPRPPTGRFALGVGYRATEGFFARAQVAQDDLFHTGQRLALSADLSAVRQRLLLAHEVPDLLGSGLDLRTELFATQRAYPGFTRQETGGALTLGKRLSPTTQLYARYQLERIGVDLAGPAAPPAAALLARDPSAALADRAPTSADLGAGLLATVGAGLAYSTLDAPLLPRRGSRLALFADVADRRLGSYRALQRLGLSAEHARPLGPLTLRLSGLAAAVRSRDPRGVPLALRLQGEGFATARGYGLVPGAAAGDNLEAVGRVELELPIVRRWGLSVAAFADAGLRYNADAAWGPRGGQLQRSVGVSIIWRSPLGPLRFDWAVPLDGDRRGPQFQFGLGGP